MINGITWLLGCQLVGELLVNLTGLPVPGPVVGMLLLFVLMLWRRPDEDAGVSRASSALLRHLQLFFVPAGVGVIVHLGTLREDAWPLSVGLVVSWLVGMLVVGWLVQVWLSRTGRATGAGGER